jgi:hypothetical protein
MEPEGRNCSAREGLVPIGTSYWINLVEQELAPPETSG